jgi:hypothetical protein
MPVPDRRAKLESMTGSDTAIRACVLQDATGRVEACESACPFWEPGDICVVEEAWRDLGGGPESAAGLLRARRMLVGHTEGRSLFLRLR